MCMHALAAAPQAFHVYNSLTRAYLEIELMHA